MLVETIILFLLVRSSPGRQKAVQLYCTMLAAGDSTVALRRWRQEALILSEAKAPRCIPGRTQIFVHAFLVEPLSVQRTLTDHAVNVLTDPVTI